MRVSFASDHNIPPGPNDPRIMPRIIVVHTMAGFIEGAERRFKETGLEAHLGFALDGRVWQWRDTDWQADAQGAGNDYCISFEFEDAGNCILPFSTQQKTNFYRACRELMPRYGIPARLVQLTSERGFGYHRQFPEWNPNKHACPCDTRQDQLIHELIPGLRSMPSVPKGESVFVVVCNDPPRIARLVVGNIHQEIDTDRRKALAEAGVPVYNLSGSIELFSLITERMTTDVDA